MTKTLADLMPWGLKNKVRLQHAHQMIMLDDAEKVMRANRERMYQYSHGSPSETEEGGVQLGDNYTFPGPEPKRSGLAQTALALLAGAGVAYAANDLLSEALVDGSPAAVIDDDSGYELGFKR